MTSTLNLKKKKKENQQKNPIQPCGNNNYKFMGWNNKKNPQI